MHVLKFNSFISKNNDAPFSIKKSVWGSALNASILYSCESWLTNYLRAVDKPYMDTLKLLLGIQHSTCNDLTLMESGAPDVKCFVRQRQFNFLQKLKARNSYHGSYVEYVIKLAIAKEVPSTYNIGCYLQKLLQEHLSIDADIENRKSLIRNSACIFKKGDIL